MNREELSRMVELLRDTAKLHQPNEEILTDVKAESFVFAMDSVLSALSAEGEYIKKEDVIKECISYADHENNVKFKKEVSEHRKHDAEVIIYACEHFRKFVNGLPTYSFPDREKGTDLISREAVIDLLNQFGYYDKEMERDLSAIPSADREKAISEIETDMSFFCFDDWGNENETWTEIKRILRGKANE